MAPQRCGLRGRCGCCGFVHERNRTHAVSAANAKHVATPCLRERRSRRGLGLSSYAKAQSRACARQRPVRCENSALTGSNLAVHGGRRHVVCCGLVSRPVVFTTCCLDLHAARQSDSTPAQQLPMASSDATDNSCRGFACDEQVVAQKSLLPLRYIGVTPMTPTGNLRNDRYGPSTLGRLASIFRSGGWTGGWERGLHAWTGGAQHRHYCSSARATCVRAVEWMARTARDRRCPRSRQGSSCARRHRGAQAAVAAAHVQCGSRKAGDNRQAAPGRSGRSLGLGRADRQLQLFARRG